VFNNRTIAFIGGAGAGSALTYLLDPMQGRRRRKMAGDKLLHSTYAAQDTMGAAERDVENRARGWKARARSRFRHEEVDDVVLEERVRSKLGRVASHPGSIHVVAQEGWITLTGDVLAGEAEHIAKSIQSVKGAQGVSRQLHEHHDVSGIPGLQGRVETPGEPAELRQEYWGPAPRLAMGSAGVGLAALGATRFGWFGIPLLVAGVALAARAVTNMGFGRLMGFGGRRGVDFRKTVHVHAPVDEVYRYWSHIENFPRFMEHVKAVHPMDGNRSHWTVAGPVGAPVTFDAEITSQAPNETLAWKSIGRTPIRHAGIVKFQDDGPSGTRLDIQMTYNPPLGVAGHAVASLFGSDPKRALDDDMVRFKSLIEDGHTRAHGHQVNRDEVAAPPTEGGAGVQTEFGQLT
jgi:uncharacterized membrane protein